MLSVGMRWTIANIARPVESVPLEELHLALVLLRRRARAEGSEVPMMPVLVGLPRHQPIFAVFKFANHGLPTANPGPPPASFARKNASHKSNSQSPADRTTRSLPKP